MSPAMLLTLLTDLLTQAIQSNITKRATLALRALKSPIFLELM